MAASVLRGRCFVADRDDYYGLMDDEFAAVVAAVRAADKQHQIEGGGTRHWLRDYLLPELHAAGFKIARGE